MHALRQSLADRAAELIRNDPEGAATAIEMGIIDRRWIDEPGARPISTSTPGEVLQRFLERAVEQRPSRLSALGLSAIELLAPGDGDEGEVRTLTIGFTDLEGFTAYTEQHGDEAATVLLEDHHREVGPVVRSRGGRIVKRLGDGFLLSFPEPDQAVAALLELRSAPPPPLQLRAGAHVGEVITTRGDVLGHVVNVAARVTELAAGGQVLVTDAVRAGTADTGVATFGRLRPVRLRGVAELVPVCEALP